MSSELQDGIRLFSSLFKEFGPFFSSIVLLFFSTITFRWYSKAADRSYHQKSFLYIHSGVLFLGISSVVFVSYMWYHWYQAFYIFSGKIEDVSSSTLVESESMHIKKKYAYHADGKARKATIEFIAYSNKPFSKGDKFDISLTVANGKLLEENIPYSDKPESYKLTSTNGDPRLTKSGIDDNTIPSQSMLDEIESINRASHRRDTQDYPHRFIQTAGMQHGTDTFDLASEMNKIRVGLQKAPSSTRIKVSLLRDLLGLEKDYINVVLNLKTTQKISVTFDSDPIPEIASTEYILFTVNDFSRSSDGYIASLAKEILDKANADKLMSKIIGETKGDDEKCYCLARIKDSYLGDIALKTYKANKSKISCSNVDDYGLIPSDYLGQQVYYIAIQKYNRDGWPRILDHVSESSVIDVQYANKIESMQEFKGFNIVGYGDSFMALYALKIAHVKGLVARPIGL